MHNAESELENEMRKKILWDFEIQTDHLISARRLDLEIVSKKKKKNCQIMDFTVTADHRVKLTEG